MPSGTLWLVATDAILSQTGRSIPRAMFRPDLAISLRCAPDVSSGKDSLELVDLTISASPFSLGRKSFDPFDQHPPVPRTVKDDYLTILRQMAPESLQVMFGTLMLIGR